MSNLPDTRIELFDQPGDIKVKIEATSKMPNANLFIIGKEDHTIGNLIRLKLLEDKTVLFAGYKVPHPTMYEIELKVQTKQGTVPKDAVISSIESLKRDFKDLQDQFLKQVNVSKGNSDSYW